VFVAFHSLWIFLDSTLKYDITAFLYILSVTVLLIFKISWSWRSIKLLLLHPVGVPYLPTYIDDAQSNTNQILSVISQLTSCCCVTCLCRTFPFQTITVGNYNSQKKEFMVSEREIQRISLCTTTSNGTVQ
jgi:hypothetical protein